jgi:hypothetical protein
VGGIITKQMCSVDPVLVIRCMCCYRLPPNQQQCGQGHGSLASNAHEQSSGISFAFRHTVNYTTVLQAAAPCSGKLLEAIKRDFGGLDHLQAKLSAESAAVQVLRPCNTLSILCKRLACTAIVVSLYVDILTHNGSCRDLAGAGLQSSVKPASCM